MQPFANYRDNLCIDQKDCIFSGPLFRGKGDRPTKKLRDLCSPNSEDAITWSVFRTLLRLAPSLWFSWLLERAVGESPITQVYSPIEIHFWQSQLPPPSRMVWLLTHLDHPRVLDSTGARRWPQRLTRVKEKLDYWLGMAAEGRVRRGDEGCLEGPSEIDVILYTPDTMVAIEAKYLSDISKDITWDCRRDQLSRMIDVCLDINPSLHHYFLLITDERAHEEPKQYESLIRDYQQDLRFLEEALPHRRAEELKSIQGSLGWTTWGEIGGFLEGYPASSDEEKEVVSNLLSYLKGKGLWPI